MNHYVEITIYTFSKIYDYSLDTQKNFYRKILLFFTKQKNEHVNFESKKIKKSEVYKDKKVTNIDDIDANKILVSNEKSQGTKNLFKYFIEYNDNDFIGSLYIKFPQITVYVRKCEGNTTISFKISDKFLLKTYNQICERVEKLSKIRFGSEPVYGDNDKYIKTKVKIYKNSMIKNLHQKICKRTRTMQVFNNNNARFCYQSKEKVLS